MHCEYTNDYHGPGEYYDSFEDLRRVYHINDPNEPFEYWGPYNQFTCLLMNWGCSGNYNSGHYLLEGNDGWPVFNGNATLTHNYNRFIYQ